MPVPGGACFDALRISPLSKVNALFCLEPVLRFLQIYYVRGKYSYHALFFESVLLFNLEAISVVV